MLLCHFPEKRCLTDMDVRFPELRPSYDGIVVCGRVHNIWKIRQRCVNIGVDVWNFTPVSESEISPIVNLLKIGVKLD